MSLGWVGAEGINVIGFQGQLASEEYAYCSKWWPYCVNNPTDCTFVGICNNCVQFLPSSVKSCCQESPPASCFQNIFESNDGSQQELSASPTASATITDPNAATCATALAVVSACEQATSNFDNLDATVQASCLCYDTANNYVPSAFDTPWSSCAVFASTADTSDYPAITGALGLCQSAGDVRNSGMTTDGDSAETTGGGGGGLAPATSTAGNSASSTSSASGSSSSGSTGSSAASTTRVGIRTSGLLVIGMLAVAFAL